VQSREVVTYQPDGVAKRREDGTVSQEQAVVLVGIEAFFAHPRLAPKLLPSPADNSLTAALSEATGPARIGLFANLERELAMSLRDEPPPDLSISWLRNRDMLEPGLVVTCEQTLTISALAAAQRAVGQGKPGRARIFGPLLADNKVQVTGNFNTEHLTSSTAPAMLAGRRRQFLIGYLTEVGANELSLRPAIIGRRIFKLAATQPVAADPLFMHPSMIDPFNVVDWSRPIGTSELVKLRKVPEQAVKQAFADLIGESVVPRDWGGERSDLWTGRLKIGGRYWSAAFLFKGPAKFAPMTIATLGKNGDQIDRLASEPADILVLQHCHIIRTEVRNMLRVYAMADWKRPRRCLVIDGYDTLRILSHFDRLHAEP
jgi:hypothetical protein